MPAVPGEPLHTEHPELGELTTKDGRKVKLKLPAGMPARVKPDTTEQRQPAEPPRHNGGPLQSPLG